MFKLKRFVIHDGIKPLDNVEMKAILGRNNSHFCSTEDRNKKTCSGYCINPSNPYCGWSSNHNTCICQSSNGGTA
ncbi:MAG: hypothetical protein AUK63_1800 [bacterium P3]|nr:MAG: hypothetical protein AUK63_1800 [bacterium P3]KWW38620.1 MAG: hypothetical protein F083_2209 [bacterium F083]